MSRRDVVVVGAGPGGAAAAHYLACRGADVLLVDRAHFPRDKACGDGLTPRAVAVLADMGLLPTLQAAGRQIEEVEIVAPGGGATRSAIPSGGGAPGHALVVPRLLLDETLRARAVASGAAWRGGLEVLGVAPDGDGVVVAGRDRDGAVSFGARIAVIATGASTGLLRRIGLLERPPAMLTAARTYFDGIDGLVNRLQLRFDGVQLPGYGWVFPVSPTAANVGAGSFAASRWWRRRRTTARSAFDAFTGTPAMRALLAGAHMTAPVRGYPLRVDFATARTVGERVLLVGEAAGLVNPLTGEGIDYALESGRLAGEHLADLLAAGDLSARALARYDAELRARFQSLFVFCHSVRRWLVHRVPLDALVGTARRRAAVRAALVEIVLGQRAVTGRGSLGRAARLLLAP
ncbi:MAG TPA: NAD(P)/FAD-dependent oxidoreductase [Candidatus Binatia bacterium]|nr:NAD(P)/FAD-dependent oxidoreductase [Candidatus Binatia bacterium]